MTLISYLGSIVTVTIDRPLGSEHPKHPNLIYPINYGFISNTVSGDGEEIDCYVLGLKKPIDKIEVRIIALIRRFDDNEDKLVGVPKDLNFSFSKEEIERAVYFQEQYFKTEIHVLNTEGAIT